MQCDTGFPFQHDLCKKCSRDGLERCPPHMSRRDAIKWKKSRGVIFRPAHSYSASVASDSSQGLRFSSPIESLHVDIQSPQAFEDRQLPESSDSHRRTQSSGEISLCESSSSYQSEDASQYAGLRTIRNTLFRSISYRSLQVNPYFHTQSEPCLQHSFSQNYGYDTSGQLAGFDTTPPELHQSFYSYSDPNLSRYVTFYSMQLFDLFLLLEASSTITTMSYTRTSITLSS